jgi:hypothetical protein
MSQFAIEVGVKKIIVHDFDQVLFSVKQKFKWSGAIISEFYIDDKLVLKTGYSASIFRRKSWVAHQNLTKPVLVEKADSMQLPKNLLELKRRAFKRNFCLFLENGKEVGFVRGKRSIQFGNPTFTVEFSVETDNTFYFLLLFIMNYDSSAM